MPVRLKGWRRKVDEPYNNAGTQVYKLEVLHYALYNPTISPGNVYPFITSSRAIKYISHLSTGLILDDTAMLRNVAAEILDLLKLHETVRGTDVRSHGDFILERYLNRLSEYARSAVDSSEFTEEGRGRKGQAVDSLAPPPSRKMIVILVMHRQIIFPEH